ncbi:ATP-binding cassette domain-containing protein [Halalkalibacter nanhaiisediminis]|uniref:Peptide/nickel transport system ATP-binding protein n=1 Tax=Halalkalibacter nanhaiisediminis TaxID=688079 RepID=A0A562QBI5_9BACI|nr:dipeptide/oligopeptide/nickel ABC transporter ATP-binding protein [Halalkalibacter nanhaiisediminis]TWI54102.1 peptide/nickel transport system ATP-binding protein [Halalkalibacter nanhaiisediminis]
MTLLLDVKGVQKTFVKGSYAVDKVSLQMEKGMCLGVVGESGSGKSTLARLILSIESLTAGEVYFKGERFDTLKGKTLRRKRREMQMVFQDPSASLNQRLKILASVMEPLDNFSDVCPSFLTDVRHSRRETAAKLLQMVGLSSEYRDSYPHQLSGGQRQRVAIARAISLGPDLVICDEPTSSLDVSIQAQILNLLKELKQTLGMSYLFISHDLAAVHYMCDEIIVMKEGKLVDRFLTEDLFSSERNVYTRSLINVAQ